MQQPGRYLTFDYWTTREAFHKFKQAHRTRYNELDAQCEVLTEDEVSLGEFDAVA